MSLFKDRGGITRLDPHTGVPLGEVARVELDALDVKRPKCLACGGSMHNPTWGCTQPRAENA